MVRHFRYLFLLILFLLLLLCRALLCLINDLAGCALVARETVNIRMDRTLYDVALLRTAGPIQGVITTGASENV